ncbi:MAG: hypothetical protein ACKVPX_07200 [Myxococcaceae bacterium]
MIEDAIDRLRAITTRFGTSAAAPIDAMIATFQNATLNQTTSPGALPEGSGVPGTPELFGIDSSTLFGISGSPYGVAETCRHASA